MMEGMINKFIETSKLNNVAGFSNDILFAYIIWTFIVGTIICVFHFCVLPKKPIKDWLELSIFEKITLSSLVGVFSNFVSLIAIGTFQMFILLFDESAAQSVNNYLMQLIIIVPFLYYFGITQLLKKLRIRISFKDLRFVRDYFNVSFEVSAVLSFIMVLVLFIWAKYYFLSLIVLGLTVFIIWFFTRKNKKLKKK